MPHRYTENDGSSYMLFSVVTVLLGCMAVLVLDCTDSAYSARVVLALVGNALVALNLLGTVSLFYRTWLGQQLEVSHYIPAFIKTPFSAVNVPWRVVRAVDHFLAFNMAFGFLLLALWAFDHERYFHVLPELHNGDNVWVMAVVMQRASFGLFATAGTGAVESVHVVSTLVELVHIVVGWLLDALILVIVFADGYELIKKRDEHAIRTHFSAMTSDEKVNALIADVAREHGLDLETMGSSAAHHLAL